MSVRTSHNSMDKAEYMELLRAVWWQLPWVISFMGLGVYLAELYHLDGKAGMLLAMLGFGAAMIVALLRAAKPTKIVEDLPLQAEIDQAYRAGFKVWFTFPKSQATRQDYLDKLRAKGYLITDQDGRIVDAFAELHDSPTRRRRRFRVVECRDQ